MIVIILGKPGSGKGTQAKRLAERLGLFYFSSGDFARDLAKGDSRIERIMNEGRLIPEKEMSSYVSNFLERKLKETKNVIFDGYPRSLPQYKFLENWLYERSLDIDAAIVLEVSDESAILRLSTRRKDSKTGRTYNLITDPPPPTISPDSLEERKDDTAPAIKKRLEEFSKNISPMIEHLKKEGKLILVDGEASISEIEGKLVPILSKVQKYEQANG